MKVKLKTSKYYRNNKKVTKFQGVLLLFISLVILGVAAYFVAPLAFQIDDEIKYWFDDEYMCDDQQITDELYSKYYAYEEQKAAYITAKETYLKPSTINDQLTNHENWIIAYNNMIGAHNNLIDTYNKNENYHYYCIDAETSNQMFEQQQSYFAIEDKVIDKEWYDLESIAIQAGYIFY